HLAAFHEDMHDEAFTYTRQTLGYPPPLPEFEDRGSRIEDREDNSSRSSILDPRSSNSDVEIPGGAFLLGAARDQPFVFDNEKWAHEVRVKPFRIARTKVSNGEFCRFVEDRGYQRQELWSAAGWKWRQGARAEQPGYWVTDAGRWLWRQYD